MNVAVIGLGKIAKYYIEAINANPNYKLVAAVDQIRTELFEKLESKNIKMYDDYQKLDLTNIDNIYILTPYENHEKIIEYFLLFNKNIFCDKLVSLDLIKAQKIISTAKLLNVVYHYRFGSEVIFFNSHYKIEGIEEIIIDINDPYYSEGKIIEQAVSLKGAWLDSAPNAFSLLAMYLDINQLKLIKKEVEYWEDIDYYQSRMYLYFNKKVIINIKWGTENNKKTTIKTKRGDIILHHTEQEVIMDGSIVFKNNQNRLQTHYQNFFSFHTDIKLSENEILAIHTKVLEGEN